MQCEKKIHMKPSFQSLLALIVILLSFSLAWPVQAAVNINTADQKTLQTLPGIGATKAKAIIDYREANGPFTSINNLEKVKGIGKGTVKKLQDMVTLDDMKDKPVSGKIDINTANAKQLQDLPGIGKAKAMAIIQARDAKGGFASLDELTQVKGINKKTLERLDPYVMVGK